MSARVKATLRYRAEESRRVDLIAKVTPGGALLALQQESRRNAKSDILVDLSLDSARLFLRQWQGVVDELYRREKEAFKAAARELEPVCRYCLNDSTGPCPSCGLPGLAVTP